METRLDTPALILLTTLLLCSGRTDADELRFVGEKAVCRCIVVAIDDKTVELRVAGKEVTRFRIGDERTTAFPDRLRLKGHGRDRQARVLAIRHASTPGKRNRKGAAERQTGRRRDRPCRSNRRLDFLGREANGARKVPRRPDGQAGGVPLRKAPARLLQDLCPGQARGWLDPEVSGQARLCRQGG